MKEFAIKENHLFVKAYQGGKRYVTDTVAVYVLKDLKAGRLRKENPKKEFLNRIGIFLYGVQETSDTSRIKTQNLMSEHINNRYHKVVRQQEIFSARLHCQTTHLTRILIVNGHSSP